MQQQIEEDVKNILITRVKAQLEERQQQLFGDEKYHINPTGKFVIGGAWRYRANGTKNYCGYLWW